METLVDPATHPPQEKQGNNMNILSCHPQPIDPNIFYIRMMDEKIVQMLEHATIFTPIVTPLRFLLQLGRMTIGSTSTGPYRSKLFKNNCVRESSLVDSQ
jgi:hypothetical protein